jgi:hypothetical protein
MAVAVSSTALLALLLFLLGLRVSMIRGRAGAAGDYGESPTSSLFKWRRAHANTAEYAPMFAVLFLYLGSQDPAAWVQWTMVLAVIGRFLIVGGIVGSATLEKVNPLRLVGALLTYVTGIVLAASLFAYR